MSWIHCIKCQNSLGYSFQVYIYILYITKTFVWIVKIVVNCQKLSNYQKCQNCANACNFQYFSKLSQNVKMVNNCRKLSWLLKMVQIVNNVEYYLNWLNCQKSFKLSQMFIILKKYFRLLIIVKSCQFCWNFWKLTKFSTKCPKL